MGERLQIFPTNVFGVQMCNFGTYNKIAYKLLKQFFYYFYVVYTMINHGDSSKIIVQSPQFIVALTKTKTFYNRFSGLYHS